MLLSLLSCVLGHRAPGGEINSSIDCCIFEPFADHIGLPAGGCLLPIDLQAPQWSGEISKQLEYEYCQSIRGVMPHSALLSELDLVPNREIELCIPQSGLRLESCSSALIHVSP